MWEGLITHLRRVEYEYQRDKKVELISKNPSYYNSDKPIIVIKPYRSVIEKSFRKNILQNNNWESPPKEGWVFPSDWFNKFNDIIRMLIVVRYADGVVYLVNEFKKYCCDNKIKINSYYQAKDEGYYAAHCYLYFPMNIPIQPWNSKQSEICIEIQITTQIQEVIKNLLHLYYESARLSENDDSWKWKFDSEEFSVNYLGHILHYLEGLIVEIRDNKEERN